jgi:hypothetical protein
MMNRSRQSRSLTRPSKQEEYASTSARRRRQAFFVSELPCPCKHLILLAASQSTPKQSVGTIFQTDAAQIVGDVRNSPGRSMFVRLRGPASGKGAAGKWTEYVAPRVMLRICDWVLSHARSTASTQYNASARKVA